MGFSGRWAAQGGIASGTEGVRIIVILRGEVGEKKKGDWSPYI